MDKVTKNSINMLLVKFGTVDRRPGSGRRSAHTDENVDTVESLLLSQEDKSQSHRTVREISREAGDPSIGATENAGVDNVARSKMQGWKTRE